MLYTKPDLPFHQISLATDRSSFTFQVRADEEAYLILCKDPGITDEYSYHIVMGLQGGDTTEVRKQPPETETKSFLTHEILTCPSFACEMWVSWTNGVIKLGEGQTVGERSIFEWRDVKPHEINALSLASRADTDGRWEFHQQQGVCF